MQRLSQAEQVLFRVEERPIYADIGPSGAKKLSRVGGRKAIVNTHDGTVVGVVGTGYRLFTNFEALQAARKCCLLVFPETSESEWQISSVDAPSTGSYCHIDLAHNTAGLEFEYLMKGARREVPDVFGPFIRVSNSYNGSRALNFSIGFFRKVCANGLVSPQEIIRFRFEHTRKDMMSGIQFKVEKDRLSKAKKSFLECFQALNECRIKRLHFVPLILSVFTIADPYEKAEKSFRSLSEGEEEEWKLLANKIDTVSEKYASEIGENAYAVLNALTELASQPPSNRYLRRDRHSLQKLAGEWVIAFKTKCLDPSFDISKYLSEIKHSSQADAEQT